MNSKESIFDNYVMDCQSEDAGDLSKSKPASLLPIPTSAPYWTSSGTAGKYLWRSLTSVFSPEVHKLDDVEFHIPEASYMDKWTFTSSDGL